MFTNVILFLLQKLQAVDAAVKVGNRVPFSLYFPVFLLGLQKDLLSFYGIKSVWSHLNNLETIYSYLFFMQQLPDGNEIKYKLLSNFQCY